MKRPVKKTKKSGALNYNLTRIEWNLLNSGGRGYGQQMHEDWSYIEWAMKFGRISAETFAYFLKLELYALGKLSVDEEIELMESVATKSWTLSH